MVFEKATFPPPPTYYKVYKLLSVLARFLKVTNEANWLVGWLVLENEEGRRESGSEINTGMVAKKDSSATLHRI